MRIVTGYDHAAWPVGGYFAYDESTYDGAPDAGRQVFAHGTTEAEALDELAAQWASTAGYEDFTTESLDDEAIKAADRGDLTTTKFINLLRAFV